MALDGLFLRCVCRQLEELLTADPRIDKIHQPSREELVIALRTRQGHRRLLLSARANSPRVHLTGVSPENPAAPPMFCMLLRKRLTGGRLVAVRQPGLERALYLDFDCVNELGDPVRLTLAAEIMGRHSNVILVGPDGLVLDAIKRVDWDMSSVRPILPGLPYAPPPLAAGRIDLSANTPEELWRAVKNGPDGPLSKAILGVSQGLSPLLCREAAHYATRGADSPVSTLGEEQKDRFLFFAGRLKAIADTGEGAVPYLLEKDGAPLEFSCLPIAQYGLAAIGRQVENFSVLLDTFYADKDAAERMRQRSHDLLRLLTNASERVSRKLENQRLELARSEKREQHRLYGDLINAHLGTIPKGASAAELVNYYDPDCATVTVPLDPALSAAANAQRYYKLYRKAQTAEQVLQQQIAAGEEELRYLDSVFDALSRARTARELEEIRGELADGGYWRRSGGKQKPPPPMGPLEFVSDDGFPILVGRNNRQNDRLTTRVARGSDVWLHVKNVPGSHVIVVCEGRTPPDRTVEQAAILAATHSRAATSRQVPVDYTPARFVKKPNGAKPGMVIYTTNQTAYVDPDPALADRLRK
ncbi:MAG: Rqc2 family fibronectin-binding protein [Acutalibacteraceae bacterium]|jgi:predicted ribosome quality control (RQC) complex YloA/Tae2 family protein